MPLVAPLLDAITEAVTRCDGEALERLAAGLASAQVLVLLRAVGKPAQPRDEWLTPGEAARITNLPVKWWYRNAPRLPFASRPSPNKLRFSRRGLQAWMEAQRGDAGERARDGHALQTLLQRSRRR